jgi:hypothetical protein
VNARGQAEACPAEPDFENAGRDAGATKHRPTDLLGTAQMATEELIQRYVRPEQVKGRRRKPYSYHRCVIYL